MNSRNVRLGYKQVNASHRGLTCSFETSGSGTSKKPPKNPHQRLFPPQPQPPTFSKLVFLIEFSYHYIFLSWLSGVLVGIGVGLFIGYFSLPRFTTSERIHPLNRQDLTRKCFLSIYWAISIPPAPELESIYRADSNQCFVLFSYRAKFIELLGVRG